MPANILEQRRIALEEEFFLRYNETLRQRMIAADAAATQHAAMAEASGINDAAKLALLDQLGLSAGTLAALTLAPLVLVAWADGAVSAAEREAVLHQGAEAGMPPGGAGMAMLESWLQVRPPPALEAAWLAYAGALGAHMAPEAKMALARHLLDEARAVARISDSFLGLLKRISPGEQAVLDRLETAFQP
jgi:uncharacterized tellurite resistance protein B-like protein